jgi:FAD/FMN-containing dehydrogenase
MIIKTSPDEIENFLTDAANVKGYCDAVYFPESESEVIEAWKVGFAPGITAITFRPIAGCQVISLWMVTVAPSANWVRAAGR